jgi:hypothetical protein
MAEEFILYHRNGGWYTKTSQLHSDWKKAERFALMDALDMCKLHDGKMLPVDYHLYSRSMGDTKQ